MKKFSIDKIIFNTITYVFITMASLACLFPFVMMISASISSEKAIIANGYSLLPQQPSLEAYVLAFKNPQTIVQAYYITATVTAVGSFFSLLLMAMAAYVISSKQFKWRNQFSFFFFFTTLFSGGVVPWYILMVRYLNLKDNLLALILPYLFSVFYIIILKTFMRSIPDSICESAKIDGAGDLKIFLQLILPLSKSALATIGLFVALNYWNDWYLSMLFINDNKMISLQYYLYRILASTQNLTAAMSQGAVVTTSTFPTETLKNAMAVIATGPILLLYPFVQKYFVKGLTVGAVKG